MDIKNIYKHTVNKQVKKNKKKWQSIKHVTSIKYIHALHWTILHREYNSSISVSVRKYTSMAHNTDIIELA